MQHLSSDKIHSFVTLVPDMNNNYLFLTMLIMCVVFICDQFT